MWKCLVGGHPVSCTYPVSTFVSTNMHTHGMRAHLNVQVGDISNAVGLQQESFNMPCLQQFASCAALLASALLSHVDALPSEQRSHVAKRAVVRRAYRLVGSIPTHLAIGIV